MTAARVGRIVLPMLLATTVVAGQQTQQPPPTRPPQQTPTFRATTDYITTEVIVRDQKGQFVSDLRPDEVQVFEDGVLQKMTGFYRSLGGRMFSQLVESSAPRSEGLILPRSRPPDDISGRIFIVFIDDMHLQALDTPKVRRVLEQIRDTVLHENDLVGIVSTGYSSIAVDLSYDYNHTRLNEAIKKVMGSAMSPADIITAAQTIEGPAGLRYNAQVAFSTAYDILGQAAKVTNKRKAFLYVSSGYDFNPFKESRYKHEQEKYAMPLRDGNSTDNQAPFSDYTSKYENPFEKGGQQFSEADLVSQIAELTRSANRANVTFYTIDPRGLMAGADINTNLSSEEWREFAENSISSLKVLAHETGGIAVVNTNDFLKYLKIIDNDMSDYYVVGWTSSNPDPLKVRRKIEIKVTRPGVQATFYRSQYDLRRSAKDK